MGVGWVGLHNPVLKIRDPLHICSAKMCGSMDHKNEQQKSYARKTQIFSVGSLSEDWIQDSDPRGS